MKSRFRTGTSGNDRRFEFRVLELPKAHKTPSPPQPPEARAFFAAKSPATGRAKSK